MSTKKHPWAQRLQRIKDLWSRWRDRILDGVIGNLVYDILKLSLVSLISLMVTALVWLISKAVPAVRNALSTRVGVLPITGWLLVGLAVLVLGLTLWALRARRQDIEKNALEQKNAARLLELEEVVPELRQTLEQRESELKDTLRKANSARAELLDKTHRIDGLTSESADFQQELKQCHSDLKAERERYDQERHKADRLTLALGSLSQLVLSSFDQHMAKPDELECEEALAESHRAERCARAVVCHHVTKIVYYDPKYPGSWIKRETAEQIKDFFVNRWFLDKDAQQLKDWMIQTIDHKLAHKSVVVFAQDIVPETVVEVPNKTCLLRRYLDAGGRVVWGGDIPFLYQGKSSSAVDQWGLTAPQAILGIDYTNLEFAYQSSGQVGGRLWDKDFPVQCTTAGRDIGLSYPNKNIRIRPVPGQSVTIAYLLVQPGTVTLGPVPDWTGDDLVLCWKKVFSHHHPHSGFMQYITGEFLPNEVNRDFFRFAISGLPLFFD